MPSLSKHNKIIHGMWVGSPLSRLELLTLRSFTHFGHEFYLWVYDEVSTPLPIGVFLRDARKIIPREKVFKKADVDPETGVGKGSYSAPFSDLFRYKLLYEHGGIWVDMDVTCLRPFDFSDEYVFRPHRVGVVGNIMKCPKGSRLMRDTYEETAAVANENSTWLEPNRLLARNVARLDLSRYIRPDICNSDGWLHYIRPFVEKFAQIPDEWYAIHWVNEFWRTLKNDGGRYRGYKIFEHVPDKDNPPPGSTLYELYRKYGLIDLWPDRADTNNPKEITQAAQATSAAASDITAVVASGSAGDRRTHLNVLIPNMVRGGAERSVAETREALYKLGSVTQNLYLLHSGRLQYPLKTEPNATVTVVEGDTDALRMRAVGLSVLQSPVPVLYTHLIRKQYLQYLWSIGVTTVPVVQNMRPGWLDAPTAYNHPRVPFVVAVSDAVAEQLRESGCDKPVITIRHEAQRWFKPDTLSRWRKEIRDQQGIRDDVLLIGMVGQFKSQKAYTRGVRVLHAISELHPAKLMILGGWDHDYGSGRTAYEAACRLAVELGVIADLITPGDVHPVEPYLAAFDIFLNTSVFEGLSVALLEAIRAGCPIVTADAGGNKEVLPPESVLVAEPSDIKAYVDGIHKLANRQERQLPTPPPQPFLVPRLWTLLAKHGCAPAAPMNGASSGTLFVTEDLHLGGPQRSLVNLLCHMPKDRKTFLCVLRDISAVSFKQGLDAAQVPVLSVRCFKDTLDKAEQIVHWADHLDVRNICFWNVDPEVKLAIAKVLSARNLRLIDVSPGPILFDELEATREFQRRISLTSEQYFQRLDRFVALYSDGIPSPSLCTARKKVGVIPLGVPLPPRFIPLPPSHCMLPRDIDSNFAIGTCCRIVPDKRLEFLIEMMTELSRQLPRASLTIVGGPHVRSIEYYNDMVAKAQQAGLKNVFFVGRHENVYPFLGQFKVFVMVGERQGCPNASLEAMSMKLPVVANPNGGTSEQVVEGMNGFLVSEPVEMAARVGLLLRDSHLRQEFGEAGYRIVLERFSIEGMVENYCKLLDGDSVPVMFHPNVAGERRETWNGANCGDAESRPQRLR